MGDGNILCWKHCRWWLFTMTCGNSNRGSKFTFFFIQSEFPIRICTCRIVVGENKPDYVITCVFVLFFFLNVPITKSWPLCLLPASTGCATWVVRNTYANVRTWPTVVWHVLRAVQCSQEVSEQFCRFSQTKLYLLHSSAAKLASRFSALAANVNFYLLLAGWEGVNLESRCRIFFWTSEVKKNIPILRLKSTCEVVHCLGNYSFCFVNCTSAIAMLWYAAPAAINQLIRSSHLMKTQLIRHYSFVFVPWTFKRLT